VTPLVGSRAAVAAGAAGAAPTTQAPAPAPAPVPVARLAVEHRDSIFKQVALKLEDSGASSMELLLEPPELGLLSLSLDLDGGRIRLVVGAERPEVAEQMRSHMLELRAALQAQGLEVTHFEVRAGTGDRGESGAHAGGSRRRGGSSPVEIGRGAPGVRLLEGSSLDILV
jgi:flagellar hook-length control protein FliK